MRLTRLRLAVPLIVLVLAAGCGGGQVTVQEVPDGPAELNVPGTAAGLAPSATATPTGTATTSTTESSTATGEATPDDTGTDATGTTDDTTTDDTTTDGTDDSATSDQPPPAGSDADQFEDFCAQNPGAC
jgi:hypothetical protein